MVFYSYVRKKKMKNKTEPNFSIIFFFFSSVTSSSLKRLVYRFFPLVASEVVAICREFRAMLGFPCVTLNADKIRGQLMK